MFITKIKIRNFKGIKSINVDLEINKNGIEKDLVLDRFKLLDKTRPVSGITAFVGRNSVGKSTIINALSFVKDVETGRIDKEIINNLIREELDLLQTKMFAKTPPLNSDNLLEFNKISAQKSQTIFKEITSKKGLFFEKYIVKSKEWFFNFFQEHYHNKKTEKIEFEIHFWAKNNKYGEYLISLNNEGNILRNIKGDFKIGEYQDYFKKVTAPLRIYNFQIQSPMKFSNIKKNFSNYYDFNSIEATLENMIKMIGEETTTKLLKLCDEDILGIKYTESQNKSHIQIKGILVKEDTIQPESLSNGTMQFLVLIEAIVRAYKIKQNYGLLLMDEIETNLHNELIQALMQMLVSIFKNFNIQSIITTHNLRSLKPLLSNKQILSIEKNNQKHQITKASKIMKPHESIFTKQEQGFIAYYPDQELIRNTIADFIYELKKN